MRTGGDVNELLGRCFLRCLTSIIARGIDRSNICQDESGETPEGLDPPFCGIINEGAYALREVRKWKRD